jgi:hypothetical protein
VFVSVFAFAFALPFLEHEKPAPSAISICTHAARSTQHRHSPFSLSWCYFECPWFSDSTALVLVPAVSLPPPPLLLLLVPLLLLVLLGLLPLLLLLPVRLTSSCWSREMSTSIMSNAKAASPSRLCLAPSAVLAFASRTS